MSDKGRNRATQLVVAEASDDFTKHTLLLSEQEHEQIDSANETIGIDADKLVSAVNCPIKDEIVPFSWLEPRFLLISQAHTDVISTRSSNRDTAQTREP